MKRTEKKYLRLKRDLIYLLAGEGFPNPEEEIYHDMLFNIGQLRDEKLDVLELRLLNTAFKELRYSLKVFKPYRNVPKAAVFGSARTPKGHPDFRFAEDFGRRLARKGWMIITGGASGIMEAAMLGAGAQNSFGLNIMLPFEQEANPIIRGNPKLMFFKYFFTRKLMFLKESAATVLFPGGFGTFDEGFESFTLVQTGKAKPRPLVLIDPPGSSFWRSTLKLFKRNMEGMGYISPTDLSLMRHFQNTEAAAHEITHFYSNYHSSRFMRGKYLIRVRKRLPEPFFEKLNRNYKDMLVRGAFERMTDLSEDDMKDPSLERIVFEFNRSNYSRLRDLIDRLNSL